jgi:glycosyltransferase involved in cell wall biosynthesis
MALTNVLVITNLYPYPWEPNRAAFNRQQFEKLAEISHVKVIVLVPWTSAAKNLAKLKTHKKNNVEIDYCAYPYPPKIGRSLYPLFIFLSLLTHYWKVKKFNPDCMLLSWAFPDAVAGTLLAKLFKVSTVIKVHGSDINVHAEVKQRRWQIKWAMEQANAVIAVSQALRARILEMGEPENKVHLLYNGIDKSLFYPIDKQVARASCNIAMERKAILFIGNLKASKGCNLLLEAYVLLAKQDSSVDLFYIGAGEQLNVLKGMVAANALEKTVHFLGPVRHDLLVNWINSSDVLALPSMNEGVPNVLLEAQSCGTPVVATNVGGIPEIVSAESGMLLEYGNKEILCETLKAALGKNWDRDKILNNNNILSWQENSSKLLDTIKAAIVEYRDGRTSS